MKCKCCGAAVTLSDEFCPYCGALNEPARKHIEDMRRYSADYDKTKTEVLGNAAKQSMRHAKIIVIIILVCVNVILIAMQFNTYEISDYFKNIETHAHAAEYREKLLSYEADGDYETLYRFYQENCWNEDSLDDFGVVYTMALYYTNITDELYTRQSGLNTYRTESESLQYIASQISAFYDYYSQKDTEYHPERYEGTHLAAMEDMNEKLGVMLRAYMSLTQDDVAALHEMETADIMLLMGKRTGYYD